MRSYNGVAIISKEQPRVFVCHDYCEKNDARHIEVEIGGYKIHSVYVPAGGDEPNAATNKKFQHKLDFLIAFQSLLQIEKTIKWCYVVT